MGNPNCELVSGDVNYRFEAQPAAPMGASCSVVFSANGNDAKYAFPPLMDCGSALSEDCSVVSGPRPARCKLKGCQVSLEFLGASGQELFRYLGQESIAYTIICDDATVQDGTLGPTYTCAQ